MDMLCRAQARGKTHYWSNRDRARDLPEFRRYHVARDALFASMLGILQERSMAPLLGKRKRRGDILNSQTLTSSDVSPERLHELFREHFESNFKPLEGSTPVSNNVEAPDVPAGSESDSEWDGCSEEERPIEVVHEFIPPASTIEFSKGELKSFMAGYFHQRAHKQCRLIRVASLRGLRPICLPRQNRRGRDPPILLVKM